MQTILNKALEIQRRQQFLTEVNRAYASLRQDSEAWRLMEKERADWDATLEDGLGSGELKAHEQKPVRLEPISNQAVFMVSLDDHEVTKLSPAKIDTASFPVWLNEQEVAFTKYYNLWKLSISSGQTRRLTTDVLYRRSLDISPDRTRFCYDNGGDIFMQSVKGAPPINLTAHISESLINATWSHDGKQIACYSPMGLKIFALVSEKLVERKFMLGVYDNPAWSANSIFGEYLAFDDYRASGIGIAALHDLKPKLIITRAGAASWSPDGTKLVYLKDKQICVSRVFDDIR